ncbi:MAG: hypothetical protein NC131_10035 [Roseburia sp.]|nr:hypothetical protein [Roseburia sp.]
MPRTVNVNSDCPHCGKAITTTIELPDGAAPPSVRCAGLKPVGNMYVYKISSELIKTYLTEKVREIVPTAKLELAPRYCEKKKRRETDPHRAYAALTIALSDDVAKNSADGTWFSKIGDDNSHVTLVDSMFTNIVSKIRFDPKEVSKWLDDYKILEDLEEAFGMNETYINELKKLSVPQRVCGQDRKPWIFFAAAPEKIIRDMLTDPDTNRVPGKVQIVDTYSVSKDVVEYIVHLYPNEMELQENRYVRAILMGDVKPKKQ